MNPALLTSISRHARLESSSRIDDQQQKKGQHIHDPVNYVYVCADLVLRASSPINQLGCLLLLLMMIIKYIRGSRT